MAQSWHGLTYLDIETGLGTGLNKHDIQVPRLLLAILDGDLPAIDSIPRQGHRQGYTAVMPAMVAQL